MEITSESINTPSNSLLDTYKSTQTQIPADRRTFGIWCAQGREHGKKLAKDSRLTQLPKEQGSL